MAGVIEELREQLERHFRGGSCAGKVGKRNQFEANGETLILAKIVE